MYHCINDYSWVDVFIARRIAEHWVEMDLALKIRSTPLPVPEMAAAGPRAACGVDELATAPLRQHEDC
jgi:hypothetical protein